ncbi:MAG: hypothetical protein IT371_14185 [Deltaproteobacteria bacterium]|nr:hypothetical protein [Deltaproteobacteria bacterium]
MTRRQSLLLGLLALQAAGCEVPDQPRVGAFKVTLVGSPEKGTPERPIPFSLEAKEFTVRVEALRPDGSGAPDPNFNGWVVIAARPSGSLDPSPAAVRLAGGKADNVKLALKLAYGPVRLVATEQGYDPRLTDAAKAQCNNGRDDDGDGYIDAADDRGCFYPNDQSEAGGAGATGASEEIFFANPRLADVQKPAGLGRGGDSSPLWRQRVTVDAGFLLVTRLSVDGLYLSDFDGVTWDGAKWVADAASLSYRHVFAFNFSTPMNIQEGDCLVQIDGTIDEFFNYTELGKPTWKKGDYAFCAAKARAAGLTSCPATVTAQNGAAADACRRSVGTLANTPVELTKLMVEEGGKPISVWDARTMQTERFESALVQLSDVTIMSEVRACDQNGNANIDFSDPAEEQCSNACGDDPGCQVKESFVRYNQWTVSFEDGEGTRRELAIVSKGALPNFDPSKALGKKIGRLVGTIRHLGFGRPAWVLEPRRQTDCPDCKN